MFRGWRRPAFGVGSSVRRVAIGALPVFKGRMPMRHGHQDQKHPASGSPDRPARQFPTIDFGPDCPDHGTPRKHHHQKAGARS